MESAQNSSLLKASMEEEKESLGWTERIYSWKNKISENQRFTLKFKLLLFLPTILWFIMFNFSKHIPSAFRPPIDRFTLADLDGIILFGTTLLEWPRNQLDDSYFRDFLDLFFAVAYLMHFAFVWIYALLLYVFYRNKKTDSDWPILEPWTFFFCWGILNVTAVATQLAWPTAPPWYTNVYGERVPSYSMGGNPAGLSNADKLLTVQLFHKLYGQSPIVFGSFPSLHGAWPLMMALFVPKLKFKIIFGFYSVWVWWAAMYLNHHFLIDLIGGAAYVILSYVLGMWFITRISDNLAWVESIYNKSTKVGKVPQEVGIELGLLSVYKHED